MVVQSASASFGSVAGVLRADGFDVEVVSDCGQAVDAAHGAPPAVVVLDLRGNPGGKDDCAALRESTDAFLIVVTSDDEHGCAGLDCGADDFVTPRATPREISARARALLRRPRAGEGPAQITCGPVVVDAQAREVSVGGDVVSLTRIEYEILATLVGQPRRVIPRRALIEAVWGPGWFGDEHVVDVHVSNLRRKIEAGGAARVVTTVRGIGYRADPPA